MEVEEYKTLSKESTGLFKDRGSKFIGYCFHVKNEDEVKAKLAEVREKEYAARHHCYAYKLGIDGKKYRANDDGEPSHSAGDPILGQIDSFGLTYTLIVVVRYFGGTKLGVGGLINAYRAAAREGVEANTIVTKEVKMAYLLKFDYPDMSLVMRYIKQYQVEIEKQDLGLDCKLNVLVTKKNEASFIEKIELTRKVEFDLKV